MPVLVMKFSHTFLWLVSLLNNILIWQVERKYNIQRSYIFSYSKWWWQLQFCIIFSIVFMIICSVIQRKNMDRLQLYVHNSRHHRRQCNKVPQLYITVGANSLIRLIEITFAISKAEANFMKFCVEPVCWKLHISLPW